MVFGTEHEKRITLVDKEFKTRRLNNHLELKAKLYSNWI